MAEEPEDPSTDNLLPDNTTAFAGDGPVGGSTWRVGTQRGGNDATRLPEISAPLEIIGDFEVLGKLGQGGMGAVYRARQVSLDRQVALKILPASLEADEEFVTRFQREARVAASLNHANLVKVYSAGLAGGCHYIAMELVEGETLGQFVRRGALPIPEALRICADVARALQCGWDRAQLIHRDIKPGNIFLSQNGEVKVGDLGLAKSMAGDTTGLTQTGTAMGTPHYISPEQARGDKDLDFRADIYSLGCTLFQMLTGRTPYEGRDPLSVMNMHINAPPPAILKVMPQCPIPLVRLVGKMLKKIKRERQASYGELIAEIERVQVLFAPAASSLETRLPADPEATLAEPQKPPTVRPGTVRAVASIATRAKSNKLPLYGGIAAGAVILIGAAAAFWPKAAPTKTVVSAQQSATVQDAATPAPAPLGDMPAESARPQTMKLWDTADSVAGVEGAEWKNGVIHLTQGGGLYHTLTRSRDTVFRASVRMNGDSRSPQLMIRQNEPEKGKDGTYYRLALNPGEKYIVLYRCVAGTRHQQLEKWNLPAQFQAGDWVPLEIRAIGDELQVSAGGTVLGSVRDDGLRDAGGVGIFADANGYFRDIEYTPLDRAAGSANPIAATTAPAWRNALDDPEFAKSIAAPGGHGVTLTSQALHSLPGSLRDGAIRVRGRYSPEWRSFKLVARRSGRLFYQMELKDTYVMLHRVDGNEYTRLQNLRESSNVQAPSIGQGIEMEFRAVGSRLTGLIDGQTIVEAEDATLSAGALGMGLGSRDQQFTLDAVEYLDLDAAASERPKTGPASGATPATASKDAPFVNTLGMKFVPVPITGGPTAGQRVLFSMWETRVQDYETFVKETQREWPIGEFQDASFVQSPAHPAVHVSWDDAVAFCAWLTGREQQIGKISPGERYRLPTDYEWSCAVGIGEQEDPGALPNEKHIKLWWTFPWGEGWPPPNGAGNYFGEGSSPFGNLVPVADYRDPFGRTSPVGSFGSNTFGLYDLAGNAREFCEDWSDLSQTKRVTRGGAWSSTEMHDQRSASRFPTRPKDRGLSLGFRVVLAPEKSARPN